MSKIRFEYTLILKYCCPMKKVIIFCLIFSVYATAASSQIIFSETFDNIPGSTNGGAGTYSFAPGWSLFNIDGRTASGSVRYIGNAWERREDFSFNLADSCAFSTSLYTHGGAADDWMATPAISLLSATGLSLKWNAVAYDASFSDGYEVRIMTVAPNAGNLLTSTVIFSTSAESATWSSHSVSLDAYAGQTVYILFRNNSNDKFLLLIDDVIVEKTAVQPITLLNFTGSFTADKKVSFNWLTTQEINLKKFTVEKSTNGATFIPIAHINAKGGNTMAEYNFIDGSINTADKLYYRLKQIGSDDKFTYSKTIALAFKVNTSKNLIVYPNPTTSDYVNIETAYKKIKSITCIKTR